MNKKQITYPIEDRWSYLWLFLVVLLIVFSVSHTVLNACQMTQNAFLGPGAVLMIGGIKDPSYKTSQRATKYFVI